MKHALTLGALALSFAAVAAAQQPAATSAPGQDVQIVVTAPTRQAIQSFVGSLASAPQYSDQMSRWDRRVCPGVIGLNRDQAQFIVDRIAQRAFQVGLRAGAPGCRADISIFVTPDAQLFAREFVSQYGRVMARHHDFYVSTPGEAALEAFQNSTRPVRWWHVSEMVVGNGERLHDAQVAPPDRATETAIGVSVSRVRSDGTRLRRPTRQEFQRVIIVVDARQVQGVRLEALSDYVAMVALAQINPDQDVSRFPTILNLFSSNSQPSPAEMSEWDVSYLQGVYHMQRQAIRAQYQRADISRAMENNLQAPTEPQPEAPH